MKLRIALLLVVAATVCALSGLISPQEAAASVDAVNQWPAKPTIVSNSNASTVTGIYTPGLGSNRLMLVAIATKYSAAGTPNFTTVSYGGQALTLIATTGSAVNGIWLGYLKATPLATGEAGTKILSVTNGNTTNLTNTYVSVAVYNGVEQTGSPFTGSGATALAAANTSVATSYTMTGNQGLAGNNGLSVYVTNWNGNSNPSSVAGYTEVRDFAGSGGATNNINLAAGYKVTTGASPETLTSTAANAFGAIAGVGLNPAVRLATIAVGACGDCHGNPPQDGLGTARNAPPGQFIGSHSKHAGKNEGQYGQICTACHKNNTTISHANGFKNVSGSKVPRTVGGYTQNNQPITNPAVFGTCSNITCHSSGRTTKQYATAPAWNLTTTCLSCHGGRSTAGQNPPARSTNNFSMSTSHSQHLKYLTGEMNCQTCHGKIAKDHTVLKDYTGAIYHGNGTKNVNFTDIAYGSYTSYKSLTSGSIGTTKTCNNTACHGGKSRNPWTESGGLNNDNTCVHCHGLAGTTPADTNKKKFAPGWATGISTDGIFVATDVRVGAHFVHLSSVFMKQIKCNECHTVPSKPFEGTHMAGTRYNSQTLKFNQASTANIVIGVGSAFTPSRDAAFIGFTSGTASVAAKCTSVYCHGNRQKNGDTLGTDRKPAWNQDTLTSNTPSVAVCSRCHGLPPTSASHPGATLSTCYSCHSLTVLNSTGTIKNKNLHIDGRVQASGGHEWSFGGLKHKNGGTGSITANPNSYTNCTGCHSLTGGGTYPVTRGVAANINCQICHTNQANFTSTPGCGDCHGTNATGQPNGAFNAFPNWSGSHTAHTAQSYLCADCHANGGSGRAIHGNYSGKAAKTRATVNVGFNTTKAGIAATWTAGAMTCGTSNCHGQKSPNWGQVVPAPQCLRCHGNQALATLNNYTQSSIAPGGNNIDTNRISGIVTPRGGMHQEHLTGTNNISRKVRCIECHASTTTVNHAAALDNMTTATMTFSGVATALSHTPTVSRVSGIMNCSTSECHHGGARPEGTAANQSGFASRAALAWNNSLLLGGTTVTDTCVSKCHMMPPGAGLAGDTHQTYAAVTTFAGLATCSSNAPALGCHPTIQGTAASITSIATIWASPAAKLLHINGGVDGGTCVGCHSKNITRTLGRPGVVIGNVVAEFGLAYGHRNNKRNLVTQVTDDDCIVCHLEGDGTTHKPSGYHKDGNINLRDPKGANETPITNLTGGAFTFQRFSTSYAALSRTNTGQTNNADIAQVITIKFCAACHSLGGATNPTARSNNGGTGTANMPFGGVNLGANYTVLKGASVAGGVINVASQFLATNSSVHPVLSPRIKDFPTPARMNAPYNNFARVGTQGTKTPGVVMNCFDCHNSNTAPLLTRRTISAHGTSKTAQVRGTFYVNSPTLCIACHKGYNVAPGSGGTHGAGSALNQSLDGGENMSTACQGCHASQTALPARPVPAADYHGYNTRLNGTNWPAPGGKPYGFIRHTANFGTTGYHRPFRGIGELTTGSATCSGAGGGCAGNGSARTYTPGGSY